MSSPETAIDPAEQELDAIAAELGIPAEELKAEIRADVAKNALTTLLVAAKEGLTENRPKSMLELKSEMAGK